MDLGHQIHQHRRRAMDISQNCSITLEDAVGCRLFSDGIFVQVMRHPDAFVFHWITSVGVRPGDHAQVNIGPDIYHSSLGAVSPDYMVFVWDDET